MKPLALIWLGGLVVAVLAYLGGADGLLAVLGQALDAGLRQGVLLLGTLRPEVVRALAIGLYAVFAASCLLAIRRGRGGRGALVLVSLGFLWSAADGEGWFGALALAATGAAVMTIRSRTRL